MSELSSMGAWQTWHVRYVPLRSRSSARSTSFNDDSMALTLSLANSLMAPNYRDRTAGSTHSSRKTRAVEVPAAIRPGIVATTLASTSAPTTISTMTSPGTLGTGTASIS